MYKRTLAMKYVKFKTFQKSKLKKVVKARHKFIVSKHFVILLFCKYELREV